MNAVKTFEDLLAWQEAHKLVLMTYHITKAFPAEEKYGLVSQMRRAAISVPANVAEGFRRYGLQEKIRFYNISEASLEELRYYLILSRDLNYIEENQPLIAQAEQVGRLLSGLIASTSRRKPPAA